MLEPWAPVTSVRRRSVRRLLLDDLRIDARDAGSNHAKLARRRQRQIEDAPTDEGAAIIDGDHDRPATVRYPQPGAERQAAVCRGWQMMVKARAGRRPTAALVGIVGS